jgi:2-polyprenyl-6-methoxyphenol hydroxylase-like FAD-dependent oxidoreductase
MDKDQSAIIVGASLSGLMSALALARVGCKSIVFERFADKPRSGAVLQVDRGQADQNEISKYLRKVAANGNQAPEAWEMIRARLLIECRRSDKIELRFDSAIESVGQNESSAWVMTKSGEKISSDFVVGADGYASVVRRHVSPAHSESKFAGYMIWVSIVNESEIPAEYRPGRNFPSVSMPDGIGDFLLGTLISSENGSTAMGSRRLGWAWYDNTRNELLREQGCISNRKVYHSMRGRDVPDRTLEELRREAKERWPQPWLAATLRSIETRNITGIPIAEFSPERIVKDRIVLVGDAAHLPTPLTASGFNASLQDAAELAVSLRQLDSGLNITDCLKIFGERRLPHARQIVEGGRSFSRSFGRT